MEIGKTTDEARERFRQPYCLINSRITVDCCLTGNYVAYFCVQKLPLQARSWMHKHLYQLRKQVTLNSSYYGTIFSIHSRPK
jgi:hypothetical protein